jgi:hypothetical protein
MFSSLRVNKPFGNPVFYIVFITKANIYLGDGLFKYFSSKGGKFKIVENNFCVFFQYSEAIFKINYLNKR